MPTTEDQQHQQVHLALITAGLSESDEKHEGFSIEDNGCGTFTIFYSYPDGEPNWSVKLLPDQEMNQRPELPYAKGIDMEDTEKKIELLRQALEGHIHAEICDWYEDNESPVVALSIHL